MHIYKQLSHTSLACITISRYSAEYSSFWIEEEAAGYRLHLSGYSGDAGDGMNAPGNEKSNGAKFTSKDRDNDAAPYNCADQFGGGWWYNKCMYACLTCGTIGDDDQSFYWEPLGSASLNYLLSVSRMMIQPIT